MRNLVLGTVLLLTCVHATAQQTASMSEKLDTMQTELRQMLALLQQTRSDLREAQEQIRQLRGELAEVRGQSTSLAEQPPVQQRLAEVEESQRISQSRIEQHEQTKVESDSKYKVKLSGMVLFNTGFNRGNVDDIDVPNSAVQPETAGQRAGSVSASLRQTLIGLQVFGPKLAGAKTSADVQFDFFGGYAYTLDGYSNGLLRMRTAHARFDWDKWSLMFGQDQPFISPNSPSSLSSVGTPSLGHSGNLWTWTPQVVAERRWNLAERSVAKLQFGVLDPFDGEYPSRFNRYAEAGERSRVPAFAARQSWSYGTGDHILTVGAGAYYSRQDYGFDRRVDGWAGTIDWDIPLMRTLSLSGEFYRGRAIGGLWGGLGTSVVYSDAQTDEYAVIRPVNAIGGWTQLKFQPTSTWEFNGAVGQDHPYSSDLRLGGNSGYYSALRNRTTMFNVIQHPRSNLLLSIEYRHIHTVIPDGTVRTAEHVDLGVGVRF